VITMVIWTAITTRKTRPGGNDNKQGVAVFVFVKTISFVSLVERHSGAHTVSLLRFDSC
jgi:hypothetical protein